MSIDNKQQSGGYPVPGYPPQQTAGYPAPGYPPQQTAGYPAPGYPPQQTAGNPAPGYPPQQTAGNPAPGYPPQQFVNMDLEQQREPEGSMQFSDKSIRLGFIRKVYSILALQLLLTFGIASIFFFSQTVKDYIKGDQTLIWVAMGTSTALIIVLVCCPNFRRKSPLNFIFLFLFTACEGVVVGCICAFYDSEDVLKAVVATIIIVVALTLFAFQTKIDFTMFAGLLFTMLLGLIIFDIMSAIFQSSIMHNLYCCLGAMLFSAYIVVDTQLLMGGKHKMAISPEEYIFAALNLYLDIINLFLMLLSLFGDN